MVGTSEQVEGVSQWRWAQVSKGPLRDMSNETFVGFRARWLPLEEANLLPGGGNETSLGFWWRKQKAQ